MAQPQQNRPIGNLKDAPAELTPVVAAKLIGDWPGYGQGIVRIPLLDWQLADRCPAPKGGERG